MQCSSRKLDERILWLPKGQYYKANLTRAGNSGSNIDGRVVDFTPKSLRIVESLREASHYLGDVDCQFTKIIQFWENIAATLKLLNQRISAGDVYVQEIKDEKCAALLKTSIRKAEQEWQFFAKICNDYVEENEREANSLYDFLSYPVEFNSDSDRSDRKKKLLASIRSDSVSVREIIVDSDAV